jgi:hypothetical protein
LQLANGNQAQLSAICEWHNQHNFCTKKHGEICFQKQAVFCLSHEKAVHKQVNEIDAKSGRGHFCLFCSE